MGVSLHKWAFSFAQIDATNMEKNIHKVLFQVQPFFSLRFHTGFLFGGRLLVSLNNETCGYRSSSGPLDKYDNNNQKTVGKGRNVQGWIIMASFQHTSWYWEQKLSLFSDTSDIFYSRFFRALFSESLFTCPNMDAGGVGRNHWLAIGITSSHGSGWLASTCHIHLPF